ncbi:hypothetical protein BY996DRAFT_6914189 [Phakopsora pachyrhizi]|uniref:Expressed protein n=1 Tax=Phakopsora pachyrhizi TaxID=170000 RepID=A0AAV0BP75_PHAPC|nr:hypothetical protein BY996DRAFT_6914189 [Phakopsora pachyrhizi]CAH7688166.1 expressed protein [Phakopsora pachyrhizi]
MTVPAGTPSKTSLTSTKVNDLKVLCQKHGLTVAGNKTDLVNRLLEFYKPSNPSLPSASASISPQPTQTKASSISHQQTNSSLNSTNPSALNSHTTTTKSNSPNSNNQNPGSKPQTKQILEDQHGPTSTIEKPLQEPSTTTTSTTTVTDAVDQPKNNGQDEESRKSTKIESEILKRQQRAQRFGIDVPKESEEEEIKRLNRIKKFGLVGDGGELGGGRLDQPLGSKTVTSNGLGPDRRNKKAEDSAAVDPEWEEKKRKRAEKFGLVDQPTRKSIKS